MDQLISASCEEHEARDRKHHKGKKTRMVRFIEVILTYPTTTETMNVPVNSKRSNENIKPTNKDGADRNRNSYDHSNNKRRKHEMLHALEC